MLNESSFIHSRKCFIDISV